MNSSKVKSSAVFRQFAAVITVVLTSLSGGFSIGWPSVSLPQIKSKDTDLVMSQEELSWMVSIMDIGVVLSPLPASYAMDHLGRKITLICSGLIFFMSFVLTAVSYNAWFLYTARFLAGIGRGISTAVVPIYNGEIASVSIRGALSITLVLSTWVGILFQIIIGPYFSFRIFAILSLIIPILFLCVFPFMPETPYFLLMKDRKEHACEALKWLRNSTGNEIVNEFNEIRKNVEEDLKNKGSFSNLFTGSGERRALLITVVLHSFQKFMGINAIVAYSSTTLPHTEGFLNSSISMVVFTSISIITCFFIIFLVDRWGRRPLLLMSVIGCVVLYGVAAVFYYMHRETEVDMTSLTWVPYVCLFLSGITQPAIGNIPYTLEGELFPTTLRSHAATLSAIINAVSTFVVDKLYVTIDINVGVYVNFLFFSICSVLCWVFTYIFVFETKGKTFLEIQEHLQKY